MLLLYNTNKIEQLQQSLKQSEIIVIGAGAGLSSAAGYNYTGERFQKWFKDFENKYHIKDMYTLIKKDCFIHKEIMVYYSVVYHAIHTLMIIKK